MHRLLSAVWLVSSAAIAYEILLMRMLSIVQWHHFAGMVISLALLGYGVSGMVIQLLRQRLESRFQDAFAFCALGFSLTMAACWVLAQQVPFNAPEVVWDPSQLLWLSVLYLLFMVPFFFAAMCIGMAFTFRGQFSGRIYFFDLLGAGSGAVLIIVLLFGMPSPVALVLLATFPLAAVFLAGNGMTWKTRATAWSALLFYAAAMGSFELRVSEFKGLSKALEVVGSRVLNESSNPLGLVTVIENRQVPVRYAPGLSLTTSNVPPEQLGVFVDGGGMSAITRWDGQGKPPEFLRDMTSALPYHLLESPHVLILGSGTGMSILQALSHGAAVVDAVELNPAISELLTHSHASFSGQIFAQPGVRLHRSEARGFAARSQRRFDLVQMGLLDGASVSGAGVQALNENYLYTVEAVRDYLGLLRPGGILAITRWIKLPPRDSLKLVNVVVNALRAQGVDHPGRRMALIRGWGTATLLVRNGELGENEIAAIRNFASAHAFDTVHYPSMKAEQANLHNIWGRPWLYEGVRSLLGTDAERFTDRYKFNIEASTDGRPYFQDFFRWAVFLEALELRDRGGAALIEWGYLVPAATLLQAVLFGFLFILLPLILAGRFRAQRNEFRAGAYFFLLGLAFLFIEIAFIQKLTLFLSHPLYAVAVVLAGFLVFAGVGSGLSAGLAKRARNSGRSAVRNVVIGIELLVLFMAALMPFLLSVFMASGDIARIFLSLILIAPLALLMGMPFPLGLRHLADSNPSFIPSAWGVNGFASVIGAVLATLLAVTFGTTALLLTAVMLYAGVAILAPKP